MNLKDIGTLLKETAREWSEDKASRLAAALSYYTIFSLAPLLMIVIAVAGLVFGQAAAGQELVGQIEGLVGSEGAVAVQQMIVGASEPRESIPAAIFGFVILLFGAAGVFGQLQDALNTMWEVEPKGGRGVWGIIKDRFLSFTLVLGIGFLLLVSLVISAALSALGSFLVGLLPAYEILMQVINFVISFGVITLLFAILFKYLPDAAVAWRDVWIGAVVTAVLFTIGKELIGLYLGRSAVASTYGAAGSLIILLLWVYYSGQIFFFGAEFTQVYANLFGSKIVPAEDAVQMSEASRIKQGIPHRTEESVETSGVAGEIDTVPIIQKRDTGQPRPQQVHRSPTQKSILALSALLLGLVSFVGGLLIREKRK